MNQSNPYDAPSSNPSTAAADGKNIEQIASGQKMIIFGILCYFAAIALQFVVGPIAGLLGLATLILGIIGIVRMGAGFGYSTLSKILLGVSMIIPLVGLIVLLVLNSKATAALRQAGYKVGLLGASK